MFTPIRNSHLKTEDVRYLIKYAKRSKTVHCFIVKGRRRYAITMLGHSSVTDTIAPFLSL